MSETKLSHKIIIRGILSYGLIVALTFICAGRLNYWQGWIYNGLNILFVLLTYYYLSDNTGLIAERLKPGEGMKPWDKIFFIISTLIYFIVIIFCALDVGRFGWVPELHLFWVIVGIGLYAVGQLIILWAKKKNKFFSSVVRIQKERGHKVCKEGPYAYVRHPGYVGGLIYTLATPLVLGSFWGLVINLVTILPLLVRTYLEDKTLQKELDGYLEYTKEVKYRLVPKIW